MATTTLQSQAMGTLLIDFPKVDLKRLKGIAKAMGWNVRKVEPTTLGELSDEECYEYLCATRPEGFELLSEEETNRELDWLGVKR